MTYDDTPSSQDEQPVRIRIAEESVAETDDEAEPSVAPEYIPAIAGVTVSRKPAAIVGIALVLCIGFLFVEGMDGLTGALTREVQVTITDSGIEPNTISVEHGQEIVWKNNGLIPQTLTSESLCNPEGDCLSTSIIRSGQEYRFSVDASIPTGTYTYLSTVNPAVIGSVVILAASAQTPEPEVSITDLLLGSTDEQTDQSQQSASSAEAQSSSAASESSAANDAPTVPVNPNGGKQYTNPIEEVQALHEGAPLSGGGAKGKGKSFTQPDTGPGLWITGILSIFGMCYAVSKIRAAQTIPGKE